MIYSYRTPRLRIEHLLLGLFFIGLFILGIYGVYSSYGPVILGTEMNANGEIEYLCAGNGCEDFKDFQISDQ